MNSGSGPDRDDFGLPPIDIQIPDDARELDRDVQAYHRELRMLRRRRFLRRVFAPLIRRGLLMPLVASCLALTLLSGTLLTMFTAGQAGWGPSRVPSARRGTASPSAASGRDGQPLPMGTILLGSRPVPLSSLAPAVLALVPPGCACAVALRGLAQQTRTAGAGLLVVVGIAGAPVATLARQSGLQPGQAGEDTGNVLAASYRPTVLTAVLVQPDGRVAAIVPARNGHLQLVSALPLVSGKRG